MKTSLKAFSFKYTRDLEGRRMRIAQIYACVLFSFLLKVAAFDVQSSYQNGGKISNFRSWDRIELEQIQNF